MIIYLSVVEILEIHKTLIDTFGGISGTRDIGALESALMRPQSGYYKTVLEEAAALMESLANNHPFLDGNKRVAFFAADIFLRINGYLIDCDSNEANIFFMKLFETKSFKFSHLLKWLQDNVVLL